MHTSQTPQDLGGPSSGGDRGVNGGGGGGGGGLPAAPAVGLGACTSAQAAARRRSPPVSGTPARTTAKFTWCFNCGDLDEPCALPLELHPKARMREHLCDSCSGRPPEPRSAYDFATGDPVPGQGFALGPLHPGCPSRRPSREEKAAVFFAPDGAAVVKVVPLLFCPPVENEVVLQRAAAALGVAPAVHAVTFSRAFAFVTMEKVDGATVADVYGEAEADAPPDVAARARAVLRALARARIHFPDAQPYNFIEERGTGRLAVIDFEHAKMRDAGDEELEEQGRGPLWKEL